MENSIFQFCNGAFPKLLTNSLKSLVPLKTATIYKCVTNPVQQFLIGYALFCQMNPKENLLQHSCHFCEPMPKTVKCDTYECDTCGKVYKRKNYSILHKKNTHWGNRIYVQYMRRKISKEKKIEISPRTKRARAKSNRWTFFCLPHISSTAMRHVWLYSRKCWQFIFTQSENPQKSQS